MTDSMYERKPWGAITSASLYFCETRLWWVLTFTVGTEGGVEICEVEL